MRTTHSSATTLCPSTSHNSSVLIQGLHDIAEIILLATNEDEALTCKLLHRLSLTSFRGSLFVFLLSYPKTCSCHPSSRLSAPWTSSPQSCSVLILHSTKGW